MLSALSREGSSPDSDGRRASPPTKLDKLHFAGYSAEFPDGVEPYGNIPDRYALGIWVISIFLTIKNKWNILFKQNFIYKFDNWIMKITVLNNKF